MAYSEILAECDGSDNTIITNRECDVSLQSLRAPPFILGFNDFIVARVNAFNDFGWAVDSQPSIEGAVVWTEPLKM